MKLKKILDRQTFDLLDRNYGNGLENADIGAMTYVNTGDNRKKSNVKLVIKMIDFEGKHLNLIFEEVLGVNHDMDLNTFRNEETNEPLFKKGLGQVDGFHIDYVDGNYLISIITYEDYRLIISAKKFKIETELV
ncbi:hypothetical protein [Dellaglioa algida]|uniref:hypothetical protein n=1 Tax=Dellaglioa algida TaxID=105612 RepID=UPI0024C4AD8B|nr:hypothetical protein [Dellaglioa algida]MDK1728476.1 hypothetical protein [Dellaglioa algida]MDK1736120.1 hypothetical protein [Dellaglioa algida]MDK1737841.1 hypothetical protein [Dellaglioa algida]